MTVSHNESFRERVKQRVQFMFASMCDCTVAEDVKTSVTPTGAQLYN